MPLSSDASELPPQRLLSAKQVTACIRLKQGASMQATWLLEDVPGGTVITIGADALCDWQIRAAGVAPYALDLMLIGGTLFAKCPPDSTVLIDGRALEDSWTEVSSGARIHIGLAQLELSLGEKTSAFGHLPQAFIPPGRTLTFEPGAQRSEPFSPVNPAAATRKELDIDAQLESQASEPTRPSFVERLSRTSLLDGAPSLLDEGVESIPRRNLWRYGLAAAATAFAYAGWLALLDTL